MYHLISYLLCYLLYIEFIVFIVFIVICVVTNHAHVCQMHDQSIQIWGEKVWTIKITAIVIQISHTFLCYTIYVLDANIRLMYRVEFTSAKRFAGSFSFFLLHLLDSVVPLSPLLSLLFAFTMDLRIHRKIWNIQAQHSQFLWTHETEAWLFRHILEGLIYLSSVGYSLCNFAHGSHSLFCFFRVMSLLSINFPPHFSPCSLCFSPFLPFLDSFLFISIVSQWK